MIYYANKLILLQSFTSVMIFWRNFLYIVTTLWKKFVSFWKDLKLNILAVIRRHFGFVYANKLILLQSLTSVMIFWRNFLYIVTTLWKKFVSFWKDLKLNILAVIRRHFGFVIAHYLCKKNSKLVTAFV